MNDKTRQRFDRLLERVLAELPEDLRALLDETPVTVDDWASERLAEQAGARDPCDLCGLYTGVPLTERSIHDSGMLPDQMYLFRGAIIESAREAHGRRHLPDDVLLREIRTTLLHEMGHHFGLSEADLERAGYG